MYTIVTPAPGITLIHGDSREVLPDLASKKVQANAAIFDPPFGIKYRGRGHRPIEGDDDPIAIADWSIRETNRVLAPNSPMFVCLRDDIAPAQTFAMRRNELRVQPQHVIWDKVHASGAGDPLSTFKVRYEPIILAHKGRPHFRPWADDGRHFPDEQDKVVLRDEGVWRYPVPKDKLSSRHPTPKPPLMFERAILPYTNLSDLVLDPFMGGAPVGIAAFRTGRRYIGIEEDAEYFALAVENLRRAIIKRRLRATIQQLAA